MMFKNSSPNLDLFCCLWLTLIGLAVAGCRFPKKTLENGQFLYLKEADQNLTTAHENYLLRFQCYKGFNRIGVRSMICVNGVWSSRVPKCIRMQCPDPPTIPNGRYALKTGVNTLTTIGSVANYSCDVGYQLDNDTISVLFCILDSGFNSAHWKGDLPACVAKEACPDPGVSPDGERKGECCYTGDALTFSCNDDYELVGASTIFCLPGGSWSSARPKCRPLGDHCDLPPPIPNGVAKGDREGDYFRPYDEVQVICKPGYKYNGSSDFLMCEEESGWEEEFASCIEFSCDPPEELANGNIPELKSTNLTTFPFNFALTYICDKGYRLIGNSWRICELYGWSGKTPRCEIIRCPDPGVPEHGFRKGDRFNIGDKVQFSCFTSFDLLGSVERFCMPNGQWNGELSRCDIESNYCPNPGVPINGMKNNSKYDMGEKVGFLCAPGHTLLGSEMRECLPNRTWSGEEVRCLGPYDFDNAAKVRDILKKTLEEKAREQNESLHKYHQALYSDWHNGTFAVPVGRILNLNYRQGRLIFYFVFDVSGSVELNNFIKSINFAKSLVKRVGITTDGARAGALTFSSKAEIQFLPVDYSTTEEVLDALDRINYTGGGTSASSALSLVRMELIPLTEGVLGKKGQKSIVFILTDGKANMGGDPQGEAKELKAAGIEIYCIGITGPGDVEKETLYKIASEPKQEHVFILQNYATLDYLMQEITQGSIDYSQCGLGHDRLSQSKPGRIAGGAEAPEPWPWMAAIYFMPRDSRDPNMAELKCGGSIIHKNFILTAAHCLYRKDGSATKEKEIIVKLGLTNVQNETNIQEFQVKKIHLHPLYRDGLNFDYDMALLQLEETMEFTAYVRPVCLPPASSENTTFYAAGELAIAIGWGHAGVVEINKEEGIKSEENLKELLIPIQSRRRCMQSALDNRVKAEAFTEHMFCAGDGKKGNDTCKGDSGGPLMQPQMNEDGNTYWTEIGIVSWGIGCGLADTYGYYTHVQSLREWLLDTITAIENELAIGV